MNAANSKKRLSPLHMKGKRQTDGFKPEDFRDARIAHGLTSREVGELANLAQSTVSGIEKGSCLNPEGRRRLAEALGMKRAEKAATKPVSGAFDELADWLLAHSTDELVLARLKYEKLLAARTKG